MDAVDDRPTDRSDGETRGTVEIGAPTCPQCGAPMSKRHCKYVCPRHGVIIDCSDPFR